MPFKRLTIVSSVVLALAASIACSQSTPTMEEPGDEEPAGGKAPNRSQAPSNTKTDDSCLGKAGLGFDDADCHKCMADDAACCQKTIACFKDDADCAALHACMLACEGGGGEGGAPGSGQALFASTVYPTLDASCGSCHRLGTGGAPIFFGADAPATYALFKQRKYHLPNSLLVTKGAHTGPALTAAQLQAVQSWVAAEGAGGGMGDGGGGGEGGGGGADGGGNGTGGGCKGQCKNAHPSSVSKWTDYNACVTSTCKAQCL